MQRRPEIPVRAGGQDSEEARVRAQGGADALWEARGGVLEVSAVGGYAAGEGGVEEGLVVGELVRRVLGAGGGDEG